MRTEVIGSVTLTYPDAVSYVHDRHIVTATGSSNVKVEIIIGYGVSWPKTLEYDSLGKYLAIDISNTLYLWCEHESYGNVSIRTRVYDGGVYQGETYNVGMLVYDGRTLADLYHGSSEVVIVPTAVTNKAEILAIDTATLHTDGTGTSPADSQIVTITGGSIASLTYSSPKLFGSVYAPDKTQSVTFEFHKVTCLPRNGIILQYWSHDGCKRYVVGEVLERSTSVERIDYTHGVDVLRERPHSIVTDLSRGLSVGIAAVDERQHLEQILLSEHVNVISPYSPYTPFAVRIDNDSLSQPLRKSYDYVLNVTMQS